ncbi:MAG: methyltransferase domain-containing protein [Planctomycetes bacterium]|nr:methyltransferase domain-containing protein [Planctomycetota bacterium]
MSFDPTSWTRLEFEGVPVYVQPEKPDWFVPNRAGDEVLRRLNRSEGPIGAQREALFLQRLPDAGERDYAGRAAHLKTDSLPELWFHITNRCNLTCSHCLVGSAPKETAELAAEHILELADQASRLGCRLFALTGGEPFIHPEFERIVGGLLSHDESHAVVLTNGTLLSRHADLFARHRERLHIQVSLDGMHENHDRIRGAGQFDRLRDELVFLKTTGIPYTLSMCVDRGNMDDMPRVVEFAAEQDALNVHFLWYFIAGRARASNQAEPEQIFRRLREAAETAERVGVGLDNIDALKSQVFAPPGTKHDGSTSGWESVAIGPDGKLYPSPALIAKEELGAPIDGDLARAWRTTPHMDALRGVTVAASDDPLRFLLGGGDPDHKYIHNGEFAGPDPYEPLYENTALWLIAREAARQGDEGPPRLRLRMGDLLESCGAHGAVALTHSNCLLSVARVDGRTAVKEFYADAVSSPREDILNPIDYPEDIIAHIPKESRVRTYGCGSPVIDAELQEGDCVLDLGSGSGVECMIAARLVGPKGRVIGVDMLDPMLDLARKGADTVAENLGYRNLDFRKGYLESLPVEDASVDVVLSNCVINLSTNKRRTYAEVLRVLRPGGRLMIADVVCETEPDPALLNDERLRGECIAGAQTQRDLFGLLEETGFIAARVLKRFPYRTVQDHPFFSMTYEARKLASNETVCVMYRGPLAYATTHKGTLLPAGRTVQVTRDEVAGSDADLFVFDAQGMVTNVDLGVACGCGCACVSEPAQETMVVPPTPRQRSGCMVCGAPLTYDAEEHEAVCSFCGRSFKASAHCEKGHYICDECHIGDCVEVIEHICLSTRETDMIELLNIIRTHPSMPIHGPEHHILVPGIILATYRNLGGKVTDAMIQQGIRRGAGVPGGDCGAMGVCGAAMGVGAAFSVILGATPLTPGARRAVQSAAHDAMGRIASFEAARCCQRDSWLALQAAVEQSKAYLPIALHADAPLQCKQMADNPHCLGAACPLHP